jgi:murein DD-endopeptidase MepM/ murein hydrolase activator NlpD
MLAAVATLAGTFVAARPASKPALAPVRVVLAPKPAAHQPCTTSQTLYADSGSLVAPTRTIALETPFHVTPRLAGKHVFPIAESESVADTFGAFRSDSGWHHGDDLFAPRGTPVLAVASGMVFSVGWQRLGGKRLWLRDDAGNQFYYAHLNSYAAHLRDGTEVSPGDILGYVGSSGDAENTPPHLHFEIHPASLLGLGYDGAVDPTRYLDVWPRVAARHLTPRAPAKPTPCGTRAIASAGRTP